MINCNYDEDWGEDEFEKDFRNLSEEDMTDTMINIFGWSQFLNVLSKDELKTFLIENHQ